MRRADSWESVPPVESTSGKGVPLWFGPSERPLFGWVHAPLDGTATSSAVLCPPLGHEAIIAHYSIRRLAEELAARGCHVVRFDYDGTGDSAGSDDDPARVSSWQDSIVAAADVARRSSAPPPVLVGMRLGALLAASVAARTGAIAYVAWDPCFSGRAFVREQHAVQRIKFGDVPPSGEGVEVPGFVYRPSTVSDLGHLHTAIKGSAVTRALLLMRRNAIPPTAVSEDLDGCAVEVETVGDQEQLLEVFPEHQLVPLRSIGRIAEWVASAGHHAAVQVTAPSSLSAHMEAPDGSPIVERAVRIGHGLFGIETAGTAGSVGPVAVFVTSSFDSHVGPNRTWVLLARRWAAHGLRCVRMDLSGIGDSPARPGTREHVMSPPEAFDDLADLMQALNQQDPSDVVWVGLCSGAYQALEAALAFGARGMCVVNLFLTFAPPELKDGVMDDRRRLCHPPSTFARLKFGVVHRLSPEGTVAKRLVRLALVGTGRLRREWIEAVRESGAESLCIFGEMDALEIGVSSSEVRDGGRLEIQIIPGFDHGLMPAYQRIDLMDRMSTFVVGHFSNMAGPNRTNGPTG